VIKITDYKTINLDKPIHKKLKKRAFEKDSSIAQELREILKKELEVDEPND